MKILASAVLVFLALIFAVPICVGLSIWLLGDPIYFSAFLFPMIAGIAFLVRGMAVDG